MPCFNPKSFKITHSDCLIFKVVQMIIKLLLLLSLLVSTNLSAHSGRTNINGCHIDRSTNIEHCHGTDNETIPKIVEPIIEQNQTEPESKSDNKTEPLDSDSKPSKMLLATYIFLCIVMIFVVIIIFAFNDLLKNIMKLFSALITSIFTLLKSIFD
jgi:hypothetical protein